MTSFYYITPFNPWAWQLFLSSYIFFKFFLKALKFSPHKIFNCFIGVTSRNFMLFMAICEGCYFPFFLHSQYVCCMLEGYWVFELIFYPATSLKLFIKCNSTTVDFFGVVILIIISSANEDTLTFSIIICISLMFLTVLLL